MFAWFSRPKWCFIFAKYYFTLLFHRRRHFIEPLYSFSLHSFHMLCKILLNTYGFESEVDSFSIENEIFLVHYIDVTMTMMASKITSLTVGYSIVYSGVNQRKHQSSASLAFVRGIHRDRWIPRTKGQSRRKCFHLMTSSWKDTQVHFSWTTSSTHRRLEKHGRVIIIVAASA